LIMVSVSLACFIISELTFNYSQVDKIWSLLPIAYCIVSLVYAPSPRLWLMAVLVTIWGLRLSFNFYRKGGYSIIPWRGAEDYRWKVLRSSPVLRGRLRFGLFNLFFISFYQNLIIFLFSSPMLLVAGNKETGLNVLDIAAAVFMLLFILSESISDNQLFRFQQIKKGLLPGSDNFAVSIGKGFMTEGMWKYVRHPNFISEQLIWISYYFFGVASTGHWINWTIAGPVLLVLLFMGSSQFTEKISSSKYPGYDEYKKKVPRYFPRFF